MRPTDAGDYGGYVYEGTPSSYATPEGNVRVWWTATGSHAAPLASTRMDGVPDVVATIGDVAEKAGAAVLALAILTLGIWPSPWVDRISNTIASTIPGVTL